MSEPFLGEIRPVAFNFPPQGWATCDGQLLPINQNQALFSLLGTTYGGDGRINFALPDLRSRGAMHVSSSQPQGGKAGQETTTLTAAEMPAHTHVVSGSANPGTTPVPSSNVLASTPTQIYGPPTNIVDLEAASMDRVGGSQAHANMQPYLVINFIIALQGIFPSRN